MTLACQHCGDEIEDRPQEAVEDSFRDEVVAHTFNPDSIAVSQTDYYCDPECFATAVEEDAVTEPVDVKDALTDGGRRCTTIVGDPQHPAETYYPGEDEDPDASAPMPDGGVPEYGAGDRFEFTAMGFQFEIAEVRDAEIELADGDVVERDEFETDLAENRVEIVDEEGDA